MTKNRFNNMSSIKCCLNCTKRNLKCHALCKEYIAEKKQWEENKEIIKKQMENIGPTSKYAYDINFMYGNGGRHKRRN